MHTPLSYTVVITKYGRMSDCEVFTEGKYKDALSVAHTYQKLYREQGVLTAIINLASKDDATPFDVDNNFAARNGVSIEISGFGMKDFPADRLVPAVWDGKIMKFRYGKPNDVTPFIMALEGEESA